MATVLVSAALDNILWEVENGTLSIFYSGKFGDQESSEVGLPLGFGIYWLGIRYLCHSSNCCRSYRLQLTSPSVSSNTSIVGCNTNGGPILKPIAFSIKPDPLCQKPASHCGPWSPIQKSIYILPWNRLQSISFQIHASSSVMKK